MSKTYHDGRHLTESDRCYIEQELLRGSTFRSIGSMLHKDPSTIAKEVKLHSEPVPSPATRHPRCHHCKHFRSCDNTVLTCSTSCRSTCSYCQVGFQAQRCSQYDPFSCPKLHRPPYVCNGCEQRIGCHNAKRCYHANDAQKSYVKTLSHSRSGISLTQSELAELNDLVSPLIQKGQPLSHIFAVHKDDIPVCRRTLYNYLDQSIFKARNIDLPRRVRYKPRKRRTSNTSAPFQQAYRNKRTYKDFERFMELHPDTGVVEMDTVKGNVSSGKCLLTLLFRSCNFMLIILLPRCTQECVVEAINHLTEVIGLSLFRRFFPVILTDNGPEFKNPYDIEKTSDGKHRTYIFYCDPYVSIQKGKLEKNHEFIRYVIPKGRSMHRYTQEDINLLASHINSLARDSLNGACPFDLAELLLDKKIPLLTGLKKVSPDEVMLKPELINRTREKQN